MKKLALTFAIVLGMGLCSYAQQSQGGGLFQYGEVSEDNYYAAWYALDQNYELQRDGLMMPGLPTHGEPLNQSAPLGGGALLLIGFGAAYALKKRNQK